MLMKSSTRSPRSVSPRHSRPATRAALVALAVSAFLPAHADDWPRFRGPNGSGIAAGAKPPTTWSDSENIRWKAELPGPGTSSPIVVGDRIFLTCYSGYGEERGAGDVQKLQRHLVCVDRATGKIAWSSAVRAVQPEDDYSGFLTEHGYDLIHSLVRGLLLP